MQAKRKRGAFKIAPRSDAEGGQFYITGPSKYRRSTGTRTADEAKEIFNDFCDAYGVSHKPRTVSDCFDRLGDHIDDRGNDVKTYNYNVAKPRRFFGNLEPKNITREDVKEYRKLMESTGVSLVTINKHLTMLDRAITYTHKEYHTPDLPVVSLKLEGVPKNQVKVWCSEEEISKLFAALNSERTVNVSGSKIGAPLSSVYNQYAGKKTWPLWFKLFFTIAITTGARLSAILDLEWDRIDGDNIDFHNPKLRGRRKGRGIVNAPSSLITQLKEAQKKSRSRFVITDENGQSISRNKADSYFRGLKRQAGIREEITIHVLRHTVATMSLKDGAEMYEVSQRLGHKSVKTTEDHYAHHDPRYQTKSKKTADRLMGLGIS